MAWFRKNWRNPIRSNSTKIRGTLNSGTPIPISLPYHSHKNPLKYGNGMGMIWEAYGKGVPLLRVPGKIPNSNPSNPMLCYTWRMGPNLVSSYIVTPIYKPFFSAIWKRSHNPRSWGLTITMVKKPRIRPSWDDPPSIFRGGSLGHIITVLTNPNLPSGPMVAHHCPSHGHGTCRKGICDV